MEAKALFSYKPKAVYSDELEFRKGDTLKILCESVEPGWHQAALRGEVGIVPSNYVQFVAPLWYMFVTKDEAVLILNQLRRTEPVHPDGAFIVRPSERRHRQMSLSVKTEYGVVEHFNIIRSKDDDTYFLWKDDRHFPSINSLISYYRTHEISGRYGYKLVKMKLSKAETLYNFQADNDNTDQLDLKRGDKVVILNRTKLPWLLVQRTKLDEEGRSMRGLVPASYLKEA